VDFTEPLDWSLRITAEDGELVRATGGVAEGHVERTWDLRDGEGNLVDAGTYTATINGTGTSGEMTPVITELVVSPAVTRRMGETRIGTSVALSEWAFESADTAIVASAAAYPDALVSGPLAGTLKAPVLLTDHGDLPEEVEDEIRRLGATRVHVIGGEAAIGESVVKELESDLEVTVDRIGGEDRFATAAMVADRVRQASPSTEVLVSLGAHRDPNRAFPDALSAGAFGADQQLPVLLTQSDTLPTATREALGAMAPESVRVFGGPVAISDTVERLVARASGAPVERFAGETRYDTSRLAAEALLARRERAGPAEADDSSEPVDLIFASGGNWPDALGAGAAAAMTEATFLLAHPEDLDAGMATRAFLEKWQQRIGIVSVAGGPIAVKGVVVTAISEYITVGDESERSPVEWPPDPNA
jgi:putative cell wall-binding protein